MQKQGNILLVGENPHTSSAFDKAPIQRLLADGHYVIVRGDQCALGFRGDEGFFQKGTNIVVPSSSLLAMCWIAGTPASAPATCTSR